MRKAVFFQLHVTGKAKRGKAKFTPEMITTGSFYIHSCTLLINLQCISRNRSIPQTKSATPSIKFNMKSH